MTTKDLVIKLYENLDCRYCRMIEECDRSYSKKGFPCDKCRDQILQDLDRLEKYKKAIEILKGRICVHNQYICYDAYADIRLKDNEIELLEEVL